MKPVEVNKDNEEEILRKFNKSECFILDPKFKIEDRVKTYVYKKKSFRLQV